MKFIVLLVVWIADREHFLFRIATDHFAFLRIEKFTYIPLQTAFAIGVFDAKRDDIQ